MSLSSRGTVHGVAVRLCILPVRFYRRWISPWKPACCRYDPTCSKYALIALERFGILKGSWLTLRRIARCHPFASYGPDPVPEHPAQRDLSS